MKRFLLAVAAVLAITVGSSFTSSAMAHGPGYGHHYGSCGPRYGGGYGYGGYGGYGGGFGGYSAYRPVVVVPSYGYPGYGYPGYGYPGYGYPGYGYGGGYGSGGVIQLYGPRAGITFGF